MKTTGNLIESLFPGVELPVPDREITSLEVDSRKVKSGSVFFARQGQTDSGANYVKQAIDNGAVLIISDQPSPDSNTLWLKVPKVPESLATIASWYYDHAWKSLELTGITGTNGKTTTSFIIRQLSESAGIPCAVIGTTGVYATDFTEPLTHTTPEAPVLHDYFQRFLAKEIRHVAMEVSSHALQLQRVAGLSFKTTIFTNLTHDHLDFHITMDEYARVKSNLFRMTDSRGTCVINMDDPRSGQMVDAASGSVLTYGLSDQADLTAKIVSSSITGQTVVIRYQTEEITVNLPLPGLFNVYNLLAAVGCMLSRGVSLEQQKHGIESLKPVPGRFEMVHGKGTSVVGVVDYSHTPDSLEKILKAIKAVAQPGQRVITVFGCGGDRDRTKRPLMGQVAERYSDEVIVTSDNPRSEDPESIIQEILKGFTTQVPRHEPDRRKAIQLAVDTAQGADIILVAGKGHETYQEIKGIRYPFDDRLVLREALHDAG